MQIWGKYSLLGAATLMPNRSTYSTYRIVFIVIIFLLSPLFPPTQYNSHYVSPFSVLSTTVSPLDYRCGSPFCSLRNTVGQRLEGNGRSNEASDHPIDRLIKLSIGGRALQSLDGTKQSIIQHEMIVDANLRDDKRTREDRDEKEREERWTFPAEEKRTLEVSSRRKMEERLEKG
ncbi:hypothetical protein PRIPAC_84345 [Pristionchus pacificus]|uniref:Uncharacterized protein n=1 Tax=Pristionchus pacificus TaxID=54126 RepID=A0A2A6BK79_PRIPA|nr:hypothetical protein PRIPAC_84345 [Pristionchus pacificus]|eukprot:PDM66324.1 hypothetical protein PRIPAC_47741 [Pristionchus pacificus]